MSASGGGARWADEVKQSVEETRPRGAHGANPLVETIADLIKRKVVSQGQIPGWWTYLPLLPHLSDATNENNENNGNKPQEHVKHNENSGNDTQNHVKHNENSGNKPHAGARKTMKIAGTKHRST